MSKKATKDIRPDQLEDIINALQLTRAEVAGLCGKIKPGAIGWWSHKKKIPLSHLRRLAFALGRKLEGKKQLEAVEERAKIAVESILKTPLQVILLEGAAVRDINSVFDLDSPSDGMKTCRCHQRTKGDKARKLTDQNVNSESLAEVSDKELINELLRRGWKFALSLEGKE